MMRHTTVRTMLASRPDLSPREQQRLEHHLSDCRECRMIGQEYRRQQAVLRQYRLRPAPVSARSMVPVRPARHIWDALDQLDRSISDKPARASRWRTHTKLYAAFTLVVTGAILLATGATMAGPTPASITNLGPPLAVQSTNSGFPLSGFHRLTPALLPPRGKAQLTFIGTQLSRAGGKFGPLDDPASAEERWPVVKALDQFGTFSNVSPIARACYRDPRIGNVCFIPTFNWAHARYRSTYLAFDQVDLLDQNGHAYQQPSKRALALYNRYVRNPHPVFKANPKIDPYAALTTLVSTGAGGSHRFPLVSIGGYVQTSSQVIISGDFEEALSGPQTAQNGLAGAYSGLPFDTVRNAFESGTNPKNTGLYNHPVEDVNAEANIITALICHATKNQPKSVCTRPIIRLILKSVK